MRMFWEVAHRITQPNNRVCCPCSFQVLEPAEELCVHKTAAAIQKRTSLGGDDFPLPLLILNKCMQISFYIYYIYIVYFARNKGRIFYWAGPNPSQQSESIIGCVSCSCFMESLVHQNKNSQRTELRQTSDSALRKRENHPNKRLLWEHLLWWELKLQVTGFHWKQCNQESEISHVPQLMSRLKSATFQITQILRFLSFLICDHRFL